MVVMANNLDQYGVIDEKLQEIIDLAKSENVPLFFEFTKRSLGKAIGKSIKIAVIGIQNADGAHQPFKKAQLMSLANEPLKGDQRSKELSAKEASDRRNSQQISPANESSD